MCHFLTSLVIRLSLLSCHFANNTNVNLISFFRQMLLLLWRYEPKAQGDLSACSLQVVPLVLYRWWEPPLFNTDTIHTSLSSNLPSLFLSIMFLPLLLSLKHEATLRLDATVTAHCKDHIIATVELFRLVASDCCSSYRTAVHIWMCHHPNLHSFLSHMLPCLVAVISPVLPVPRATQAPQGEAGASSKKRIKSLTHET